MSEIDDPHRITGKVWLFGDSIDTDAMYPGYALRMKTAEAARHVFYDLRPGWIDEVSPGDIVVAGRNFGVGSSRPVAALFRHLGVAALVAEEFNSLFLRNAINNGLPALTVPGAHDLVNEGDVVTVQFAEGWLACREQRIEVDPMPSMILDILDAGGLMARLVADGYFADVTRNTREATRSPAEDGHSERSRPVDPDALATANL